MARTLVIGFLSIFSAAIVTSAASANGRNTPGGNPPQSPGDVAAQAIYTENIPTSSGSQRVGPTAPAASHDASKSLSSLARQRLRHVGTREAALLTNVATSPALGAPPSATRSPGTGEHPKSQRTSSEPRRPHVSAYSDSGNVSLSSGLDSAIFSGGNGVTLVILLVAVALTSVICGGAAARRRGRKTFA